jgi:hypothetical protein
LVFERIESLFEAVAASGVERLPTERRYARREQSLRDGLPVSDHDWTTLQELLADLLPAQILVARSDRFLPGRFRSTARPRSVLAAGCSVSEYDRHTGRNVAAASH